MSCIPAPERPAAFGNFLTWFRRTRPFPYPKEVAGTAMALFYLVGGVSMMLVLAFPHPLTVDSGLLLGLGAVLSLMGLAVYKLRKRIPSAVHPWMLAADTGLITVLTATGGSPSVTISYSFFYLWVIIYALLFLNPLAAALQIGLAAAAYISVAVLLGYQAFEPIALITVIATTGGVIMWLSQAREQSVIDPLTLVSNRRGLDRILHAELHGNSSRGGPMVVGMIDVDHFKDVNDHLGHAAGDQLLEDLTRGWKRVLRGNDALGRIGGDEFVVVLPSCSPPDADLILERLRVVALQFDVTCSVGGALLEPGDSISMLLGRADTALYQAKSFGRNQVAWAAAA